jgi:5'(3')-deoxyribonucleotidase
MIIAIDVDDVLADFCGEVERVHGRPVVYPYLVLKDAWPHVDIDALLIDKKFHEGIPAIPGARTGVQKLLEAGHTCFYMTSRQADIHDTTVDWLRKAGFPDLPLTSMGKEKAEALRHVKIDVLIDDMWKNVKAANEGGAATILYNQCWNDRDFHPYRAYNWHDVLQFVSRIGPGETR